MESLPTVQEAALGNVVGLTKDGLLPAPAGILPQLTADCAQLRRQ
ncbi:hypothetical protein [Streptomyces sp. WM4235]|nr:hypothetical protein [Streptomyces sp. WM4235]